MKTRTNDIQKINRAVVLYMGDSGREPNGCEIYRGNMPMAFLSQNGDWITSWVWFGDLVKEYGPTKGENIRQLIRDNDIFIFPRVSAIGDTGKLAMATLFAAIRDYPGRRIVWEVDDDYTNQHRHVTTGDAVFTAKMADAITVSTPHLEKLMRGRAGRPTYVLPNSIDPFTWRDYPRLESHVLAGKKVIGLTGSMTHKEDWRVLETVMPRIMAEHPEVAFLVMGYQPEYLYGLPNTHYIPSAKYSEYSQVIRNCDIILAPVSLSDPFNDSKSPIKAIEGQGAQRFLETGISAGAAVIATNNHVYQMVVRHDKTGLLVQQTPEDWYEAITRLLVQPETLTRLQIEGYKRVYEKFDMSRNWVQWDKAYKSILKSPQNGMKLKVLQAPS
jgi:glycosyltransferase involved in cell wall biosynthesis